MSRILCLVFLFISLNGFAKEPPAIHPEGTNFGGLFVLEDWFLSSSNRAYYVATPCGEMVGDSRIFLQDKNAPQFYWTSETNLISQLENHGYSDAQIVTAFAKHRHNFLQQQAHGPQSLDDNFLLLHNLGITAIRLPVTWALIYPNQSYTIQGSASSVTIPASTQPQLIDDPFYAGSKWAGIPVSEIENILQAASRHHIKVMIDIHAYPGGSGDGTYNGVWPNAPRFWTVPTAQYQENFNTIVSSLITWVESLYTKNPDAAKGLWGINPINEPAHLFGIPTARCDSTTPWGLNSYQDLFDTLQLAVNDFRNSSLPAKGAKLDMNIIETIFPTSMSPAQQYQTIGTWWKSITTSSERKSWATLDIHHYIAWDNQCNQCINQFVTNHRITNAGFLNLANCSDWYLQLRAALGLESEALINVSEFSASTNQYTPMSCASGVGPNIPINQKTYRDAFFKDQIIKARQAKLGMFFWSWVFPNNTNFQREWSLYTIYNEQRGRN